MISLLGGKCARCPASDPRVLQVDHIYGADPRAPHIRSGANLYQAILSGHFPLAHAQLLCANCNQIKKADLGEVRGYRKERA